MKRKKSLWCVSVQTTAEAEDAVGELLGRVDIPGGVFIAPVVANGTLYLYNNRASLIALQ